MTSTQQQTGTHDAVYDLVSVLYHSLQGAENYAQYASDAGGDQELAQFFQQTLDEERQRAEKAKQLLHRCFMRDNVPS